MTQKHKTEGFVFKKSESGESDIIFSVFTKDFGKIDVKGKAIRKINSKLKLGLDLSYFSEIEFVQGKSQKILTDATAIKTPKIFLKTPKKTEIIFQICSLLDGFIKGQEEDKKTFELISEVFDRLYDFSLKEEKYQTIYQYFFWNFISLQGYCLQVKQCAGCHEKLDPDNVYFSTKEGGTICQNCFLNDKKAKKVDANVIKIIRIMLSRDWDTLFRLKSSPALDGVLSEMSGMTELTFCPY